MPFSFVRPMLPRSVGNWNESFLVREDANGRLICNCDQFKMTRDGRIPMCDHIRDTIGQSLDNLLVIGEERTTLPHAAKVMVPIAPVGEMAFEAEVLFQGVPDDNGIDRATAPPSTDHWYKHASFSALVAPSDGRMMLRSEIIEFLHEFEVNYPTSILCMSCERLTILHRSLRASAKAEYKALRDLWHVYKYAKCWECWSTDQLLIPEPTEAGNKTFHIS